MKVCVSRILYIGRGGGGAWGAEGRWLISVRPGTGVRGNAEETLPMVSIGWFGRVPVSS